MQRIVPFLWFDSRAEEAANFYVSIFKSPFSGIKSITRYGKGELGPEGTVMSVTFLLEGQEFIAFNGGPRSDFTKAGSLFVKVETQGQIDQLYDKLSEGGQKGKGGWLADKYGVSWQIVPTLVTILLQDKDTEQRKRIVEALLQMDKIQMNRLRELMPGPSSTPLGMIMPVKDENQR